MSDKQNTFKPLDLALIAMFSVLTAVCAWISIPLVVPFTLQTFAVFMAVLCLGGKRGTLSVLVYLLLGAVGVPVFAGFTGGIGVLTGVTGGYLVGFLLIGLFYWLMTAKRPLTTAGNAIVCTIGLLLCYTFGTIWFYIVYARQAGGMGVATILVKCVVPFILPDAAKIALAIFLSGKLRKRIRM